MILARTVDVTRRYGDALALAGVSLEIRPGELVGLLGPNGAGKTTLLNLLVGLRRPTSGLVEIFGADPRRAANRRLIGVTPQETGLPPTLRVGECVDYVAAHFTDPINRAELLGRFGLDGLTRRQTGGLSGGQRRRLAVALAFVGRPRLIFLDEPTTGLDVEARHALWDGIRAFHADGGTVLLTSHYLEEVEALAQRVVVLGAGRVLADDTVAAVRGLVGVHRVSVAATALPALAGVVSTEESEGRVHLLTTDADQLVRDLVTSGTAFHDLEIRPTTLEEAFLSLMAHPTVHSIPDPAAHAAPIAA
jgi:ABC-2 type transport system ATP-binding protein